MIYIVNDMIFVFFLWRWRCKVLLHKPLVGGLVATKR